MTYKHGGVATSCYNKLQNIPVESFHCAVMVEVGSRTRTDLTQTYQLLF